MQQNISDKSYHITTCYNLKIQQNNYKKKRDLKTLKLLKNKIRQKVLFSSSQILVAFEGLVAAAFEGGLGFEGGGLLGLLSE